MTNEHQKITIAEFKGLIDKVIAKHFSESDGLTLEEAAHIVDIEVSEATTLLYQVRAEQSKKDAVTPPPQIAHEPVPPFEPTIKKTYTTSTPAHGDGSHDLLGANYDSMKDLETNKVRNVLLTLGALSLVFCCLLFIAWNSGHSNPRYRYDEYRNIR